MNCEICYESVESLCYLQCTHSLCQNCLIGIKNSVEKTSRKLACPWCRYKINSDIFKTYLSEDLTYYSPFLMLDEARADAVIERMIQEEYGSFDLDRIFIPRNRYRRRVQSGNWNPRRTYHGKRRRKHRQYSSVQQNESNNSRIANNKASNNKPSNNKPSNNKPAGKIEGKKSKWTIKESMTRTKNSHR